MSVNEPTTIGLSEQSHRNLKRLLEEKFFRELLDGYRFAIALALAQGVEPEEIKKRVTIFNVGTLDPDQSIKLSIKALKGKIVQDTSIYKMAEGLAEWGVNELTLLAEDRRLDFVKLFDQARIEESCTE